MEIEVVERRKQIEVEEKEIVRKEKELIAVVRRPAEAEAYRMELIAEGNRFARDCAWLWFTLHCCPVLC